MRHDINLLIEKSPDSINTWIPPRELGRLLGLSTKTITSYRNEGRFRSSSIRAVNEGKGLTGNTTAMTPLKTSGGWHDLPRLSNRFFWNGPHQSNSVRVLPRAKVPDASSSGACVVSPRGIQGEINDMELSEEVRRIARKRRHILNGWIRYYREQLQ